MINIIFQHRVEIIRSVICSIIWAIQLYTPYTFVSGCANAEDNSYYLFWLSRPMDWHTSIDPDHIEVLRNFHLIDSAKWRLCENWNDAMA